MHTTANNKVSSLMVRRDREWKLQNCKTSCCSAPSMWVICSIKSVSDGEIHPRWCCSHEEQIGWVSELLASRKLMNFVCLIWNEYMFELLVYWHTMREIAVDREHLTSNVHAWLALDRASSDVCFCIWEFSSVLMNIRVFHHCVDRYRINAATPHAGKSQKSKLYHIENVCDNGIISGCASFSPIFHLPLLRLSWSTAVVLEFIHENGKKFFRFSLIQKILRFSCATFFASYYSSRKAKLMTQKKGKLFSFKLNKPFASSLPLDNHDFYD